MDGNTLHAEPRSQSVSLAGYGHNPSPPPPDIIPPEKVTLDRIPPQKVARWTESPVIPIVFTCFFTYNLLGLYIKRNHHTSKLVTLNAKVFYENL